MIAWLGGLFRSGDEEADEGWRRMRFWGVILAIFGVSAYYSVIELQYMISSTKGPGVVLDAYEDTVRARRGRRTVLRVDYSYSDEQQRTRRGSQTVSIDSHYAPGQEIEVQYFPGSESDNPTSRMAGTGSTLSIWMAAGALAFILYSLMRLAMDANEPVKSNRPKKRRRRPTPAS